MSLMIQEMERQDADRRYRARIKRQAEIDDCQQRATLRDGLYKENFGET